jgi:SAM-dependent methyltransferase
VDTDRSPDAAREHPEAAPHAERAASFGPAADLYHATRPTYPDEAVAWCVPASARDVVDLAAGTGKLTERIVAQGVPGRRVTAVEPSPGMRATLAEALPGVAALDGSAEATGLPTASADVVTVAQAWHWFDAELVPAELARVLRPGGVLAVIWNVRDTGSPAADWLAAYEEIIHRGDPLEPHGEAPVLGPEFGPVEHRAFPWTDAVRPAMLRDLAGSRSHLLTLPAHQREAMLAEIDELAATHPDLRGRESVPMPYRTDCYRARRV